MKYAVDIGSGVMIYIPVYMKIGSGIYKLLGSGEGYQDTQNTQTA
jgi:hypothetical protein